MSMTREEIYAKVQETLMEALGVEEDEVTEDARLMEDLGAESIDFLDIVFRLEKAFEIKIPREELFPGESVLDGNKYIEDGKVNAAGIAELRSQMPHVDMSKFEKDPDINKIGDLFRVSSIVGYVESKLNGG